MPNIQETYAREEFLAEEGVAFEGLGLRAELVAALAAAGFTRPASTQVLHRTLVTRSCTFHTARKRSVPRSGVM